MNKLLGLTSFAVVFGIVGCQTTAPSDGWRPGSRLFKKSQPPPTLPPAPVPVGHAPFGAAPSGAGIAPSGAFPTAPPAGFTSPPNGFPGTGSPPSNAFPTAPPAGDNPPPPAPPPAPASPGAALPQTNPNTQVEFRWQPGESKVQLAPPVPITDVDDKKPAPAPSPAPAPAGLPVGIAQFAAARDNVATGLRPSLDEGVDWLQARGYKTVLHVRQPGEDDDADRKAIEKRGMTYMALEVSPLTLSKMTLDEFTRIVRDKSAQPLFVYDRDAALAGGLWFLFYRSAEGHSEDVARIRAGAVGFREDQGETHRAMWAAIQDFLRAD